MITVYTPHHWQHDTRDLIVDGQALIIEEIPLRAENLKLAVEKSGFSRIQEPEDFGLEPILSLHDQDYINFLMSIYDRGRKYYGFDRPMLPETFSTRRPFRKTNHPIGQMGYYSFATFSPIVAGTWKAAYWSAQCALTAAKLALSKKQITYAICRPPGHHAGKDYYGGFCYINNAALAAKALPGRTAILDIDFHHGNGTQDLFYDDPEILFASIHADPDQDYPYFWGSEQEKGIQAGEGLNLNFPLPLETTDAEYLEVLNQCLQSLVEFKPENLVVSVGLDFLINDPVGGFKITRSGLQQIARQISELAKQGLTTVLIQEGGYALDSLGTYITTFLQEFVH